MTLRQGNEIDSYDTPTPEKTLPTDWHSISNDELENHHWGMNHLDAQSWRFYLPAFLGYSVRHPALGESLVIDTCILTLRSCDSAPPKFKTLTEEQRRAIVGVLEFLAFDPESQVQDAACQALEEYL